VILADQYQVLTYLCGPSLFPGAIKMSSASQRFVIAVTASFINAANRHTITVSENGVIYYLPMASGTSISVPKSSEL
jgi:hypothetical protein